MVEKSCTTWAKSHGLVHSAGFRNRPQHEDPRLATSLMMELQLVLQIVYNLILRFTHAQKNLTLQLDYTEVGRNPPHPLVGLLVDSPKTSDEGPN